MWAAWLQPWYGGHDFDDDQLSALAGRASLARFLWIGFRVQDFFIRGFRRCRRYAQQSAAMLESLVPLAIG